MRKPLKRTSAARDRDTRRVGLFIGDDSAGEAKPRRASRSSKCKLVSNRRAIAASIHARIADKNNATMSAANPGKRLANLVRKRVVESTRACLTCCHIHTSDHVQRGYGLKRSGQRHRETR